MGKRTCKREMAGTVAADAAPAPEMPKMTMSQILPLVVMLGMNQFDVEKEGYTKHVEVAYILVTVALSGVLFMVYQKIQAVPDGGTTISIPAVTQFGQEIKPACEQTIKEHDLAVWQERFKQHCMSAMIMGGVYYKWGYIMPLVLQTCLNPIQLYEAPIFEVYMLGKKLKRPFPTPSPFGMPTPAQPADDAQEEAAEPVVGGDTKTEEVADTPPSVPSSDGGKVEKLD